MTVVTSLRRGCHRGGEGRAGWRGDEDTSTPYMCNPGITACREACEGSPSNGVKVVGHLLTVSLVHDWPKPTRELLQLFALSGFLLKILGFSLLNLTLITT